MRWKAAMIATGLAAVLTGCVTDEREWMKLNATYTRDDFRRDVAACTKSARLDEACMRDRGWVAVNPNTPKEKSPDPHARDISPGRR